MRFHAAYQPGPILVDAIDEFGGPEVVADTVETGHQGEVGAGDREEERAVGGITFLIVEDVVVDPASSVEQRVLRVAEDVDGGERVGDCYRSKEKGCGDRGEGFGAGFGEDQVTDYNGQKQRQRDGDDKVVTWLQVVVIGEEGGVSEGPEHQDRNERVFAETTPAEGGEEHRKR